MFRTLTVSTALVALLLCACLSACLSACNSWDADASFPETYSETYTQLHECKESEHPAADYVITWLSPEGAEAWETMMEGMMGGAEAGGGVVLPEGTVLVKAQYDDATCSTLSGYTAMEKLAPSSNPELGDFRWQFLDADGSCKDCDAGASCSGCHTLPSCGLSFPYVCTSETGAP